MNVVGFQASVRIFNEHSVRTFGPHGRNRTRFCTVCWNRTQIIFLVSHLSNLEDVKLPLRKTMALCTCKTDKHLECAWAMCSRYHLYRSRKLPRRNSLGRSRRSKHRLPRPVFCIRILCRLMLQSGLHFPSSSLDFNFRRLIDPCAHQKLYIGQ